MGRETVGLTEVIEYDSWASYNGDASRTASSISFIQQDNSIVVGGKRYSQNAECYVGSDAEGVDSAGVWYLCGEATIPNSSDLNIIGSAQVTNGRRGGGLFLMSLRADSGTMGAPHFQWLTKNGNSIPTLRLVISGTTVKLYCKVYGGRYVFVNIRFYNQVVRTHNHNKQGCFKLANSTIIIPEADVPSGTDIADVPYLLKDGTAANSKKVNMYNTTDNAERRVLFGHDYNTNGAGDVYKTPDFTYNPSTKTLTVPNIAGLADEAKKVANKLQLTINGKTTQYDGSAGVRANIATSKTHAVIAQGYGINWTAPPSGVSTPGVALAIEPYSMGVDDLKDGDTVLVQIPTTLTNASSYPLYFQIDVTRGTEAGNLIPIIRGQSAGTPVQWLASTTLTNGFYMFVYSVKLGGLIFMYRNTTSNG